MERSVMRQLTTSLPTVSMRHNVIASNVSAPFDLYCLKKDHKFLPITRQILDPKPYLLISSTVNEADVVNTVKMLQFELSNKEHLLDYLNKDIVYKLNGAKEKEFLTLLFLEVIYYSAQKDFSALKLASLLNIYISTHNYMKSNDWRPPKKIWDYFKEVLIRLTVEDSPDGQEVFTPEESYDILSHFHTIYMNNLPLIHILVFGTYHLRFSWPFN